MLALGIPVHAARNCGARLGASTIESFVEEWIDWFVAKYYDEWVHGPRTEDELREMESLFSPLGLLGAITSMDGVHIPHFRCAIRVLYTGKEGFPTLVLMCM